MYILKKNSHFLRDGQYLKDTKKYIQETSGVKDLDYDTKIRSHCLVRAINKACGMFKSCFTNYIHGNIKRFRIRYLKYNKEKKELEFEASNLSIFGELDLRYNKKKYTPDLGPYKLIGLRFDSKTNKYYLMIPEKLKKSPPENAKGYIGIDPGIRCFMTGLTETKMIKIGTDVSEEIGRLLSKIKNESKDSKKARKIYFKIHNIVDDLHWKTIKYLTSTYEIVLIGDFSIKSAAKREKSVLNGMTKEIGHLMRFTEFRKRLQYKCGVSGTKLKIVNERYTSKVCSNCGNCKNNLGGNKVYKCSECGYVIDRDVNGCRGILIKSVKNR